MGAEFTATGQPLTAKWWSFSATGRKRYDQPTNSHENHAPFPHHLASTLSITPQPERLFPSTMHSETSSSGTWSSLPLTHAYTKLAGTVHAAQRELLGPSTVAELRALLPTDTELATTVPSKPPSADPWGLRSPASPKSPTPVTLSQYHASPESASVHVIYSVERGSTAPALDPGMKDASAIPPPLFAGCPPTDVVRVDRRDVEESGLHKILISEKKKKEYAGRQLTFEEQQADILKQVYVTKTKLDRFGENLPSASQFGDVEALPVLNDEQWLQFTGANTESLALDPARGHRHRLEESSEAPTWMDRNCEGPTESAKRQFCKEAIEVFHQHREFLRYLARDNTKNEEEKEELIAKEHQNFVQEIRKSMDQTGYKDVDDAVTVVDMFENPPTELHDQMLSTGQFEALLAALTFKHAQPQLPPPTTNQLVTIRKALRSAAKLMLSVPTKTDDFPKRPKPQAKWKTSALPSISSPKLLSASTLRSDLLSLFSVSAADGKFSHSGEPSHVKSTALPKQSEQEKRKGTYNLISSSPSADPKALLSPQSMASPLNTQSRSTTSHRRGVSISKLHSTRSKGQTMSPQGSTDPVLVMGVGEEPDSSHLPPCPRKKPWFKRRSEEKEEKSKKSERLGSFFEYD
ncbi:hypothetical protein GQ43DRAFT_462730 [Delitschia confertaspora ATCC 74209]|uniref:Uncharacterized protein n=1 Tax=Delitschia confertaspora ATCC 74209 TaxID=1513339 RepID=A0A9P4JPG3_9PLEO|nr:hypothetical protein GQ43DRAFT_462730 [Delitschia confertaspora ATCC 74209]